MSIFKKNNFPPLSFYPKHIAFIMDGNGRWAKKRALPRSYGHLKGSEKIRVIANACYDFNIKALTLYAFSTENWKRPKEEVDYLFSLVGKFFNEWMDELISKKIKVIFSGFLNELPEDLQNIIRKVSHQTQGFQDLIINICLNYGATKELNKAIKEIVSEVKYNNLDINKIDEDMLTKHLFTKELPPVDLMIRTGGEKRLSNFLLYQLAYSEIYFCDTLWPDFDKKELYKALKQYTKRDRRFGGIKK